MAAIASRPPISGMSRSIRITSGSKPVGGGDALAPVLGLADHVEVLEELQEATQAASHDRVVVDQQHSDRPFFVNHRLGPLHLGFVGFCRVAGTGAGSMHQREHPFRLRHVAQPLRRRGREERPRRGTRLELIRPCSRPDTASPRPWPAPGDARPGRARVRNSGRPCTSTSPLDQGDADAHATDRPPVLRPRWRLERRPPQLPPPAASAKQAYAPSPMRSKRRPPCSIRDLSDEVVIARQRDARSGAMVFGQARRCPRHRRTGR